MVSELGGSVGAAPSMRLGVFPPLGAVWLAEVRRGALGVFLHAVSERRARPPAAGA